VLPYTLSGAETEVICRYSDRHGRNTLAFRAAVRALHPAVSFTEAADTRCPECKGFGCHPCDGTGSTLGYLAHDRADTEVVEPLNAGPADEDDAGNAADLITSHLGNRWDYRSGEAKEGPYWSRRCKCNPHMGWLVLRFYTQGWHLWHASKHVEFLIDSAMYPHHKTTHDEPKRDWGNTPRHAVCWADHLMAGSVLTPEDWVKIRQRAIDAMPGAPK
jgi:hypothetical protein